MKTFISTLCTLLVIMQQEAEAGHRRPGPSIYNVPPATTVHVIAPSGKGAASDLSKINAYISLNNLVPFLRPDIYSNLEPIYANTDEYRAMDLIDALTDNSTVIWAIRGGAGAARLIPYLEAAQFPPELSPKLLIGFSDITVLHTYMIKRFNWTTVHGGMLSQLVNDGLDPDSVSMLWDLVFNRRQSLEYNLVCMNEYCRNVNGSSVVVDSKVIGGNLVLVQASIGTAWETETDGKLVFLEDTGEAPYRTERTLDHLKQAGLFSRADGVLLGDFIGSGDEALNLMVLQRFAESLTNVTVYRISGIGHARRNLPLPLNSHARISGGVGNNRLLTVEAPTY